MEKSDNLTPVKFHFYSLKFTPYKAEVRQTSNSILTAVITYITQELQKGKGHLIDRHEDRDLEGPRQLFMTSAVFMHKESRIRCNLALLRTGRLPMLKPADKFHLVPLDKAQGSIAEQTHFYVDYSKGYGVICVEFNYNGPRISDIEYYFRNIARDTLKLSKVTEVNLFMNNSIDKTLVNLKNVLNMDIKIQPQKLAKLDTDIIGQYFTGLNTFGNRLKPKYIKLEAMYQTPGSSVKSTQINKEANHMVLDLIKKFSTRPLNIDCFDNFVVKYEDKDGQEEVFNLLKGKKEIVKEIDLSAIKKERDWYELIETDYDEFMQNL